MKKIPLVIVSLFLYFSLSAQDKVAPDFKLSDINGNKVALSDFKGKVVYMDFWATWCGPCVAEMPHSKKLKEKYKDNKDIVFVYVSFDSDDKKWKSFLSKKGSEGVQLISREGKEGDVLTNYNVLTIPRFILVDKKGNIASFDAKRPSEPGLAEDINKLLAQ